MKRIVKSLFRTMGIDLVRYLPSSSATAQLRQIFLCQLFDAVVDVGANRGNYYLNLKDIGYKNNVIAFEPLSSAYYELQKIAKRDPRLILPPRMALGDSDGEVTINVAANSESSSLMPMLDTHLKAASDSVYIGTEIVPVRRLDAVLFDYLPSQSKSIYLKIDVQGFEQQVLNGATAILSLVKGIQLELSLIPLYEGQLTISAMINYVQALGFTIYAILPAFTENLTGRTYQVDGIFIRPNALPSGEK